MASSRAPKQHVLTTSETLTSFEAWKSNLVYILSLDNTFAPFLESTWLKSKNNPTRGLHDDGLLANDGRTAAQKKIQLELMLGMIANYAPVISRNTIIKQSTSLASVWTLIKQHYHFQSTGSQFLDFCGIRRLPEERPEDLYQRLHTFVENGLLTVGSGITHHEEACTEDEDLSPTLESMIVLRWLELIHKDLPRLVQQRYCTEIRSRTLPSIRHEISLAIDSLLDEINLNVETRALTLSDKHRARSKPFTSQRKPPVCPICSRTNRPSNHFLSKCELLPDADRKYLLKARTLSTLDDDYECTDEEQIPTEDITKSVSTIRISRIEVESCPHLDAFYGSKSTRLTLDTGCTGNIVRLDVAKALNIPIKPTKQRAIQADGATPLDVVGEVQITFNRDSHDLLFKGLVSRTLDVPILAGTPFQSVNDVYARPNRKIVYVKDSAYPYTTSSEIFQQVRLCSFDTLRSDCRTSVYPGDYLEVSLPSSFHGSREVAVEPVTTWLDLDILDTVGNKVRMHNNTDLIQVVKKHEHLCRVRPVITADDIMIPAPSAHTNVTDVNAMIAQAEIIYSQPVSVDPSKTLTEGERADFHDLHSTFDEVFGPVTTGYNGSFGSIQAVVNMGPTLPPQRRGRIPLYPAKHLQLLQDHLDVLEEQGVIAKPESLVRVNVKYVNPTFLVKKSDDRFHSHRFC